MPEEEQRKIRIAIVGYGNLGKGVHQAILRNPDTQLAAIISRDVKRVRNELGDLNPKVLDLFDTFQALSKGDGSVYHNGTRTNLRDYVDVAVLCGGSKEDLFGDEKSEKELKNVGLENATLDHGQGPAFAGIWNTVCSFDTHPRILDYFDVMNEIATIAGNIGVISAGWDPGVFSLERVLGDSFLPGTKDYTFWGPGVSQGHSNALRQVEGVEEGIQYTMPKEDALKSVREGKNPEFSTRQKHWRDCYVALKPNADQQKVAEAIVNMPNYFADYDTKVTFETSDQIRERKKQMPHGGSVIFNGQTGMRNNVHAAQTEYQCHWGNNSEATGNILVACARAANRLSARHEAGAFTMLDIPPALYNPHSRKELLKHFM